MGDDILLTEISDGVATLTLNRPRQINASSAERRRSRPGNPGRTA